MQFATESSHGRSLTPRIVVVGGGFAGLEVAKALGKAEIGVTIIDRHNHHLFQPLLYQVATAALSAPDIAEPIRKILGRYPSVQVLFGDVTEIGTEARILVLADGTTVPYDILVLATGSQPFYFGQESWARVCPGLKTIEDARTIRSRLLLSFEHAERTTDPVEQSRLMTIAIIGGGPTGVELAGSIAELSRHTLARDFRNIRPEKTRIILVEAGERLLAGFAPELSRYARLRLESLGVEVALGNRVEAIEAHQITVGGQVIPVALTLWAAGVAASPLVAQLGVGLDRGGRVKVESDLQVVGHPDVFALGDVALVLDGNGQPLPGLAQVAKQQGEHLGMALARRIDTGDTLPAFAFSNRGNTAIVGRHAAVFESGRLKLKGWIAWSAWALIHVYLLVGFQHRVQVSIQWLWRYLTYERGARLIAEERVEPGSTSSPGAAPREPLPPKADPAPALPARTD
ncbi:NAD(P)/FAD-dependent oxidoreductase [Mesorhizobium sp. M0615]|uniref:NAD(P)/FAD-dependent oxidoreductase n=1 Tax=unclassified Mesorhizobium TaxID=325217 RepID=UPI0003CF294B|nr:MULTISPECIES: NAD(P)/FAD-dependent oxidoreductase [unclassified Mesorhizobium]ESW68447.1 FAD-dependent pyridine nucleotide-disulfide oxidoreductase [Mesorhizobium sp. LSJC277A00]ESZ53419.1 FAD-dependent pyridine nucleotide-disulfide oxidoreductase [Mesorhizobium sp. L103C131B0]